MRNALIVALSFFFSVSVLAQNSDSLKIIQLEKRLEILEKKAEEDALSKLIEKAEATAKEKKENKKTKVFKSGQRSLQAINPEISVTGDMFAQYSQYKLNDALRNGFIFRGLGLHFSSALDPFSTMKAALEFGQFGIDLGEAYITWMNVLPRVSVTAGKFRQQFGVINRWHVHALDQVDFPLALTTIFG